MIPGAKWWFVADPKVALSSPEGAAAVALARIRRGSVGLVLPHSAAVVHVLPDELRWFLQEAASLAHGYAVMWQGFEACHSDVSYSGSATIFRATEKVDAALYALERQDSSWPRFRDEALEWVKRGRQVVAKHTFRANLAAPPRHPPRAAAR